LCRYSPLHRITPSGISICPAPLGADCAVQDAWSPSNGTVVFELLKGSIGAIVGSFLGFASVFCLTLRNERRKRRSLATAVLTLMDGNKQMLDYAGPKIDRVSPLSLIDETLTYNLLVANAHLFRLETLRLVLIYAQSIKNLTQYIEDFKKPEDRDDPKAVACVKDFMADASEKASWAIKNLLDEVRRKTFLEMFRKV
jgi:hypothetical protein